METVDGDVAFILGENSCLLEAGELRQTHLKSVVKMLFQLC